MDRWRILVAAPAQWAVLLSASFAQTHGSACLSNRVGVPRNGQYFVHFQPGTSNQFIHVTK